MASFILSELAKKDITDIWNYTASEWPEEQAIRYFNGLMDICERIASNPEIIVKLADIMDTAEQTLSELKSRPGFADISAVKNNKIWIIKKKFILN